ncbi:hypothetical protein [Botrimarina sp.]|uniref:hypothetical protein n=1 Tax=Botrimarina sp. TaxID=2795802 RepID=UPI0032EDD7FA
MHSPDAQQSHALAFEALELYGASRAVDMRGLHHRYSPQTGRLALRAAAAGSLRAARSHCRATARKVWRRHAPQVCYSPHSPP